MFDVAAFRRRAAETVLEAPGTLGSGGSLRVVRDGSAVLSSRESFALFSSRKSEIFELLHSVAAVLTSPGFADLRESFTLPS
jgi:hypothetical protein